MPTRRTVMIVIAATALLVAPQYASGQSGAQAVDFVKSTNEQLVAVANSASSPEDQRRRVKEVIDSTVDIGEIAQFCLGRFWSIATPEQQKQYTDLFHELMVTKIADHLGEYQGAQVVTGFARTSADTEIVITTVKGPRTPARRIDWVVGTATGAPKIVDVLADGVSLRLTQSADFTTYLERHTYNVDDLIHAMGQMISQSAHGRR